VYLRNHFFGGYLGTTTMEHNAAVWPANDVLLHYGERSNKALNLETLSIAGTATCLDAPPHKFCKHVIEAIHDSSSPELAQILTGDVVIPPCPSFLYCQLPALPWVPALQCHTTKLKGNVSDEARPHPSKRHVPCTVGTSETCTKRLKPDENAIDPVTAQQIILAEFGGEKEIPEDVSGECRTALSVLVQHIIETDAPTTLRLSHDAIYVLITAIISETSSAAWNGSAARLLLLPALRELNQTPTQALHAALQHLGKFDPGALVERCILPALEETAAVSNRYFAELMAKAVKEKLIGAAALLQVIEAIVVPSKAPAWSDHTVLCLLAAVDKKPPLNTATLSALLAAIFSAATGPLKGSVKLSKLLLAIIRAYGRDLDVDTRNVARQAAQSCGTFMTKAVLTALDALERNC
jgi:hypothetical protein